MALKISIPLAITLFCSYHGHAQFLTDSLKAIDLEPKVVPEMLHFKAQVRKKENDGSFEEIDTTTGYHKIYDKTGQLKMEGKVVPDPTSPKGSRDGIWNYYGWHGLLMTQEIYKNNSKQRELEFLYFKNEKPSSETLQYFEGDYKDKASFKLIKIEVIFYMNGQKLSERHSVNGKFVYATCWDSKGNQQPLEYLKTVKSVSPEK
jgi:antitoxin component YwqK of YwqJK toxin-antitoxin module